MTVTTTILNLGDSVTVDITAFDAPPKTDYVVVDTVSEPGKRESLYQKTSGDEEYPQTVRVGHYANSKANDGVGQTNISVKISTFVQKVDGTDIVWTLPATATLAMSMPGNSGVPDTSGVVETLNNLFAWVLPIASASISTDALDELKFGVTGNLAAHVDSGTP